MERLKDLSADFRVSLKKALDAAGGRKRKIAVFDADWTLWSGDIGEAFLRWLIAGRLLKGADYSKDIYVEYEKRVEFNRADGYAWAVALMAGLVEEEIKLWCRQLSYAWPNYRPLMRSFVDELKKEGFEVWVISASNDWVIKAASGYMGIEPAKSIGIRVEVENGILTDRIIKPVTCNYGKVETIELFIGERPLIACGDSLGDLEMLEYAEFQFIAGRAGHKEAKIIEIACSKGWAIHFF